MGLMRAVLLLQNGRGGVSNLRPLACEAVQERYEETLKRLKQTMFGTGPYAPDPFRSRFFPVDSVHLRSQVGKSPRDAPKIVPLL